MRITDNAMNKSFLTNLNRNMRKMMKAQEQATSGKSVSRPSDNPLLVGKILSMRDNIKQNEQFNSNINDAIGWVQTQDTALNDVSLTMNKLRDLIIYGATDSLSPSDRLAIRDQVESTAGELQQVLNTNFDGRYIFGGQETTEAPFGKTIPGTPGQSGPPVVPAVPEKIEYLHYNGNNANVKRNIAQGVTVDIPTDGSKITQIGNGEDDNDLGKFIENVMKALDEDDTSVDSSMLSSEYIGKTDKFIDNILQFRSKIGATHNRLESAEERNTSENINLKEVLSEKEDVDLAESYMNYIMMTTAYQASLSMGAKILQPSLLDYLR